MKKIRSKLARRLMDRIYSIALRITKPAIILIFDFVAKSLFGKSINDTECEPAR